MLSILFGAEASRPGRNSTPRHVKGSGMSWNENSEAASAARSFAPDTALMLANQLILKQI